MTEIEWTKMVLCPQTNQLEEVDNCAFCGYYENENDMEQTVTCNYEEKKE